MELSAKMPATQNAQMPARMEAKRESDAPQNQGEGGSMNPMATPIVTTSKQQENEFVNLNDMGERIWNADKKTGPSDGYSLQDRKKSNMGGLPQRDSAA